MSASDARTAGADRGEDAGEPGDGAVSEPRDASAPANPEPLRVVLFSATQGYRHESIPAARDALLAAADGEFRAMATEDAATLIAALATSDVAVFLMTTGDVLDDAQQAAFESFIRNGGGFVGIHSAADTEYDWPFYGELIVSWFASHPAIQHADLRVEQPAHASVAHLPASLRWSDEWYNFRENPRSRAQVVLTVDESSYSGGTMGADHPIAWYHEVGRGRAFYTALGHPTENWSDARLVEHVMRAIRWAGGR